MFKEILEKGYYCFEEEFNSWEDAIKASYQPLVKNNIVNNDYINEVIRSVKKYGPYIVIIPNVAMPHSTEGAKGCNGTAISFMKVNKPVDFDKNDEEKKARLFFSLAAMNHDEHLKNIQGLMDVLMNEDYVDALLNVHTEEELIKVVEKFEN